MLIKEQKNCLRILNMIFFILEKFQKIIFQNNIFKSAVLSSMNKYTLFFKDRSLESKYQADSENEREGKLFCLVRLELIVCLLSTLYHAIEKREFNDESFLNIKIHHSIKI